MGNYSDIQGLVGSLKLPGRDRELSASARVLTSEWIAHASTFPFKRNISVGLHVRDPELLSH